MKKSTMLIGALLVVGTVYFASGVFADDQYYRCNTDYNTVQNSGNNTQYANANVDSCPWYQRWFGFHKNGCTWNNSRNSDSGTNQNAECCR